VLNFGLCQDESLYFVLTTNEMVLQAIFSPILTDLSQPVLLINMNEAQSQSNSYLPDFHKITRFIVWLLVIIIVAGALYIGYVSIRALSYRPERIINRFVSLIENPTQTVTETEKEELQDITQSGFFNNWGNENNIKTLRRISQGNPIAHEPVVVTGESKRTGMSVLKFDNDFQNPDSQEATVYIERYGTVLTGIRWQIFKIDMPREDNPLDDAQNTLNEVQDNLNDGTQNVLDRVRNWFGQ
jgi:hypothetical protein